MDKLSMSLDDIIKKNRTEPRRQNKNVNNRSNNQGRRQNRSATNKFGIIKQSKRIGKNNRIKRNNNSFLQRNPQKFNKTNKMAILKSRLSMNKPIGQKTFRRPKPNMVPKRQINGQPQKRWQQPKRQNNKANFAMTIAKKNLEKAKRVLANRISKVKQIAAKINTKNIMPQRKNARIKRLNSKANLPRTNLFKRQNNFKSQSVRGRKNIRTNNRKVFY